MESGFIKPLFKLLLPVYLFFFTIFIFGLLCITYLVFHLYLYYTVLGLTSTLPLNRIHHLTKLMLNSDLSSIIYNKGLIMPPYRFVVRLEIYLQHV